jgi:hypothetical protein
MTAVLCRILDSDELPVAGIRVTVTSLQNSQLTAFSGLDGIVTIWASFSNSVPQQDLKRDPYWTPTTPLAKVSFEVNRPSLPRPLAYISLDPTRQACIILRLLEKGFQIQSSCLPLPSEASYGFQQRHNIHDIHDTPLLCNNEEGHEEIGASY